MATDTIAELNKVEKKPSSKHIAEFNQNVEEKKVAEPEPAIRTSQAGSNLGSKPSLGMKPKIGGGAFSRPALGGSKPAAINSSAVADSGPAVAQSVESKPAEEQSTKPLSFLERQRLAKKLGGGPTANPVQE